jgi:hypothetical protein
MGSMASGWLAGQFADGGIAVTEMDSPPEKSWQVAAAARDLGLAHELGDYRHDYERRQGGRQWGCGFLLAMAGVMIVLPGATALAGLARVADFVVAGSAVAIGVLLIRTARRQKIDRILVYDGGIAQVIDGEGEPRVIRWSELGPVRKWYTRTENSEPMLTSIEFSGTGGTSITAGSGGYGWSSLCRLEHDLDPVVLATRLPEATRRCQLGEPVAFGDLILSPDGLAWDRGQVSWQDIRSIRLYPGEIELKIARRRRTIELDAVPDSCVAVRLIQDLAARRNVPLRGEAQLALPPFAVPAPPGLVPVPEPAALVTDAVLTAADVSQVLGWPVQARVSDDRFHTGTLFHGGGMSVRLTLRKFRKADRAMARGMSRAVPGAGDEAWLLAGGKHLVMRAGPTLVMLAANDLPPAECELALTRLAQILASRLPGVSRRWGTRSP